jgi:hypothetical protein
MNIRWHKRALAHGRLALGVLLAILALPAAAQTGPITTQSLFFDNATNVHNGDYLDAQTGIIYTDNVGLTHDGPGDTLAMIGLVGDTKREGAPRFDYHVNSDIAYVKYFSESFPSQPFGYFDGSADFKILPGLFSWTARDSFSQVVLNQFAPATPDNLESINYISTGPRFMFQPTLRTSIVIDGTYSYVDTTSKSPAYVNINNHRAGADAKIERAFSNTLSGYIAVTYDKVQFTNTVDNTDFNQAAGVAGFRYNDARTVLDAEAGYTKLKLINPPVGTTDTTPDGVTWKFDLSRVITPTQRVSLHAASQVTDAPSLFRLSVDQPTPGGNPYQIATGQPYTHRDYGATWHIDGRRTTLDINALYTTDDYTLTPADNRKVKSLGALLTRQLNPTFKLDVGVSYEHDDYSTGGTLKQLNLLTSLRWRLGERLGLRFIYAHTSISPNDISENQIGVTVAYNLLGHGSGHGNDQGDAPGVSTPQLRPTNPAMQPRL